MIQRSLLRATKSVNTRLPSRTFTSLRTASPLLRPQSISPSSSRIASRWYSDAAPAKDETKADEPAKAETSEVEILKKDLEAKNKEIIDLKVPSRLTLFKSSIINILSRTNTSEQ
jgi:molecular chaperone GrpE